MDIIKKIKKSNTQHPVRRTATAWDGAYQSPDTQISQESPEDNDEEFTKTKTYFIPQLYAASMELGIDTTILYDLSTNWLKTSLLHSNHSYTDAFYAFQTAENSLKNSSFSEKITDYPNVKGYKFEEIGVETSLMWCISDECTNGETTTIELDAQPDEAWDAINTPLQITTTLQLSIKPIYLRWFH